VLAWLLSAGVGLAIAGLYHYDASRMVSRLIGRSQVRTGLLFVLSLVARFTVLGLVLVALRLWTPLRLVVTAIAFMAAFVLLHGYDLNRYAVGKGPFSGGSSPASRGSRGGEGTAGDGRRDEKTEEGSR
jgi:hypothetical protein